MSDLRQQLCNTLAAVEASKHLLLDGLADVLSRCSHRVWSKVPGKDGVFEIALGSGAHDDPAILLLKLLSEQNIVGVVQFGDLSLAVVQNFPISCITASIHGTLVAGAPESEEALRAADALGGLVDKLPVVRPVRFEKALAAMRKGYYASRLSDKGMLIRKRKNALEVIKSGEQWALASLMPCEALLAEDWVICDEGGKPVVPVD